jgi:osmoprotectant transport system substrate-binding protein
MTRSRWQARGGRPLWRIGIGFMALLALSVVLAACGSSKSSSTSTGSTAASSASGSGKPAVTIGAKNFAEANILGNLYAQALKAKGFNVNLIENVGSSELIHKALTSGRIQMYPEYTGTLLSAVAKQTTPPKSEQAAYEGAKAFVEKEGATLLEKTPFYDSDALATLPSYASKHQLVSIAGLKPLGKSVTLGGPPEFATRSQALPGLEKEYGVKPTFRPVPIEASYNALESGQVQVQDVFTTDGQLLGGKFKVLADPKHVFGFQNVAPVVKKTVVSQQGPAFGETINKVSKLLTIPAIQQMNKAVSVEKQSPSAVAKQFLTANGLA